MANEPLATRIADGLKKVTIEPFLFFIMFGYHVRLVTFQSLLMDRACRIMLNFTQDVCEHLEDAENDYEQALAVKYGNNLYVGLVLVSTLPALVLATFLGPWSDKYSRKYPLILSSLGIFLDALVEVFLTAAVDASPLWFIACSAISGMSGGIIVALSSTYSYLSDVTDERTRPTRYAILEFFTIVAMPLGALVGGQVLRHGGYIAVMAMSPCSFALASLWAIFFLRETKPQIWGVSKTQILGDLFQTANVRASYRTCVQKRPGNLRLQIWLLVFVSCTVRMIYMGSIAVSFPFTRRSYKWDATRYSNAWTVFSFLNAVATLVIVPMLNKKLQLHEAAMGVIGIFSLMARMVITSVAFVPYIIFYAWFCGIFNSCSGVAIRSRISKLVSKKELGRVFSLLAICESLAPVLGTVSFTQIYNASEEVYPGLIFALATGFLVPCAVIFAWMTRMPTMSFSKYVETEDNRNMQELKDVTSLNFSNESIHQKESDGNGSDSSP